MFAEGNHPDEEQHLEPAVEVLRFKTYGLQEEVKPLVRGKLATAFAEFG